jgi:hypothetical protein
VGRRHPRAGTPSRGERSAVHQHARAARGAAVLAAAAPTACCWRRSATRTR